MQQGKRKGAPDNGATREDLAILCSVPGATYAQIGEFYGLSERWAQKWCSRYGLKPTTPHSAPRPSLPSPSKPIVRLTATELAEMAEKARRGGFRPESCPSAFVAPTPMVRERNESDVIALRQHARAVNGVRDARAFRQFNFSAAMSA